jgi:hypothetical protein
MAFFFKKKKSFYSFLNHGLAVELATGSFKLGTPGLKGTDGGGVAQALMDCCEECYFCVSGSSDMEEFSFLIEFYLSFFLLIYDSKAASNCQWGEGIYGMCMSALWWPRSLGSGS